MLVDGPIFISITLTKIIIFATVLLMSNKTKTTQTTSDKVTELASQAGMVLMTAAATIGMLELPDHSNSRIIVPNRPALVVIGESTDPSNNLRREREETAPHFISYAETQRTPSRSGRS